MTIDSGISSSVARDADLLHHPDVLRYVEFSSNDAIRAAFAQSSWMDFAPRRRAWYADNEILPGHQGYPGRFMCPDPEYYNDRGIWFLRGSGRQRVFAAWLWTAPPDPARPMLRRHLFCRYVLVIEPDVAAYMTEAGVKLPGFESMYDQILHGPENGKTPNSWKMWHGPNHPTAEGKPFLIRDYVYDGRTGSGFGAGHVYGGEFAIGVPITIELELNMGPIGSVVRDNGRVWIDGVYKGARTIASDVDIDAMIINIYHGGMGLAKQPIHYRLAAACIATKYIGVPKELRSGMPLAMPPIDAPWQSIDRFDASPPVVKAGQSSLITWKTSNATKVFLDGASVAASGTLSVTPSVNHDYALEADGPGPKVSARASLTIEAPAPPGTMSWRRNWTAPIGTFAEMPGSGINLMPSSERPPAATIDAWCGLAATATQWWSVANGGHEDSSDNGAYVLDLTADAPAWKMVRAPSAQADRIRNTGGKPTYYADGLPNSRHTYQNILFCAQRNRVLLPMCLGGYLAVGSASMDGFDVVARQYDPKGTYPDCPAYGRYPPQPSVAVDPNTGDVYVGEFHKDRWYRWDCASNKWEPSSTCERGYWGACVDTKRNRLILAARVNADASTLPYFDLATGAVGMLETGIAEKAQSSCAIIHDIDADQYYWFNSTTAMFRIDPDTGASTRIETKLPGPVNGVWTRIAYFGAPIFGIMYYPRFSGNIWFMATAAFGAVVPQPKTAAEPDGKTATVATPPPAQLPLRIRDHPRF
ncbi:MAG TPA: hypothetical protein VJ891_09265, partial [Casimicrobiaceae bacterium]|nr:hypothetical protein [Casimicrobiaceae bacterium]